MSFDTSNLKYYIINNHSLFALPAETKILNIVYDSWCKVWQDVFQSKNDSNSINKEDIYRPNYIVAIFSDLVPVAFHLYSFFDLNKNSSRNHPYFESINPDTFASLKNNKVSRVMSMEYLTVMPNFRKKETGINWGEILISLGQKFLYQTNCDACIGTARTDVKVDKMGEILGFKTIQNTIKKYDYECDVMASIKKKELQHPSFKFRKLINELWSNRIDFESIQNNDKIAA
jgi:hypothetical protein